MADITVAVDEAGADQLFDTAVGLLPPQARSDTGTLGPFTAGYAVTATFAPGDIDLIAPGSIRITDMRVNWSLDLTLTIDLASFLPEICLPQVCIPIPCVGTVCSPKICLPRPTIPIHVSFGDTARATADFGLSIALVGGMWKVETVVQDVIDIEFGTGTAALLGAIGAAVTVAALAIPLIGPFVAIVVGAILLAIGIAEVTGFLGPIISPFVSGLRIPIYKRPQMFQALSADGPNDPAVFITLDQVNAFITSDVEDELVLEVDFS